MENIFVAIVTIIAQQGDEKMTYCRIDFENRTYIYLENDKGEHSSTFPGHSRKIIRARKIAFLPPNKKINTIYTRSEPKYKTETYAEYLKRVRKK